MSGLAEVVSAHEWYTPRGYAWVVCDCGQEFAQEFEARAHVAAQVTAHLADRLASPEVVEAVACEINGAHDGGQSGSERWTCLCGYSCQTAEAFEKHQAEAALAVVRDVLVGEVGA